MKNKKILYILIGVCIIIALFGIILINSEKYNEKQKIKVVEKSFEDFCGARGGVPSVYKTGYSENCGFDVYRLTCFRWLSRNGKYGGDLIEGTDSLVVNDKRFDFDIPIEFPEEELNNLNENYYREDYDEKQREIIEKYDKEVCDYLNN